MEARLEDLRNCIIDQVCKADDHVILHLSDGRRFCADGCVDWVEGGAKILNQVVTDTTEDDWALCVTTNLGTMTMAFVGTYRMRWI